MRNAFTLTFIYLFFMFSFFSLISAQKVEYTPNTDLICNGYECTMTVYGYEANFFNESIDEWIKINESFYECGSSYCTPQYHFFAQIDQDTSVTTAIDDTKYVTKIIDIYGQKLDTTSYIKDNEVIFPSLIPKILELHYLYVTDMLKETYIFNSPPTINKGDETFNITYENTGDPILFPSVEVLCDAKDNCIKVQTEINKTNTVIPIPSSFLSDKNTVYPVTLDPSQAFNGTPNTTYSGYVDFLLASYNRFDDPGFIKIGQNESIGSANIAQDRAALIFDISSLPKNISIKQVMLRISVVTIGNNGANLLNFTSLELSNASYPNDNNGNNLFFNDMGNGTILNLTQILITGNININITPAGQEIIDAVSRGWYGIGIRSQGDDSLVINLSGKQDLTILSRIASSVPTRPLLNITFSIFTMTVISPINTTYTTNLTLINVSAVPNANSFWYQLNNGQNITFIPNITIQAAEGFNKLDIYANDSSGIIVLTTINFTVNTKSFLMEIFLLFECITLYIFSLGLEKKTILYPMLSMGLFFGLSAESLSVQPIFWGNPQALIFAPWVNFGLGLLCLVYVMILGVSSLREAE